MDLLYYIYIYSVPAPCRATRKLAPTLLSSAQDIFVSGRYMFIRVGKFSYFFAAFDSLALLLGDRSLGIIIIQCFIVHSLKIFGKFGGG